MEDNIQTIIVVVISVFLLFIFPVYMAYEKKDDVSYALAMRYTQDLVDEVRNKGYITKYMYEDYRAKLKVTGNSYDIQMKHEYNRYDPITKYYTVDANGKYTLLKTTTQEEKEKEYTKIKEEGIELGELTEDSSNEEVQAYIADVLKNQGINKVEDTYELSTQTYTTNHILNVLNSERKLLLNASEETVRCGDDSSTTNKCQYAYTMNVDDNFNVTIKNTNVTLATVIYNMVTANVMDENTRIYVNYGGTILSSKWYGDIDYSKLEPTVSLDNLLLVDSLNEERKFTSTSRPIEKINTEYDGEYKIEFDVKPDTVTELKEKGDVNVLNVNYNNFNFALGNSISKNQKAMLSVAVGYNGILLLTNASKEIVSETNAALSLGTYNYSYLDAEPYIDEETGEEKIRYITKTGRKDIKITDCSKVEIERISKGKIRVKLISENRAINGRTINITVSDPENLWEGLDREITNPSSRSYTGILGETATRGTNVGYSIIFEETAIKISAKKIVSQERIILSYPMAIKDYINVEIEVKQNDAGKYTAKLFVDGEKMEESVEMDVIPKVDSIGMTYIGTQRKYFTGSIKNVKIYN